MPDDPAVGDLAWRFLITYDGPVLTLQSVTTAAMRAGSSDPVDDLSASTGFWYDLNDGNGNVLFRRITSSPMRGWSEIPDEDGNFTVAQQPVVSGTFELLTPVVPGAATLTVFGADPALEDTGSFAVALATFDLGGVV